ncbi:MAG TPA: adenylyltransferase/cytidyltransferase family protein [Bacteroidia bacterium]|jgi:glycerol-3-phosphate cytidylyltransferase
MKRGFACGVFDLFHAGHVLMLKECKAHCDYLIVALNSAIAFSGNVNPGKQLPVYSLAERKLIMESCRYVDEVRVYNSEDELLGLLKDLDVSVRFLGEDYRGKPITGAELGIPIHYTDRSHGLSTSVIRKRIMNGENT